MTSKPPSLPIDDDDAFDAADDISSYILSPDEIREDMARYISDPESNREGDREGNREGDSATSTGSFFMFVSTSNDSSTLPNDSGTPPNDPGTPKDPGTPLNGSTTSSPRTPSSQLSLSSHFSSISLSTPDEERLPDHFIDHQRPSPLVNGNDHLGADEVHSSGPDHQEKEVVMSSSPDTPIHTPQRSLSVSSTPVTENSVPTEVVDSSPYPVSAPATTSFSLPAIASSNDRPDSNYLVEKPRSRRPHRSTGPSTFEKVRSQTRPVFLPPKPKDEDNRHMADWQQMMKASRLAGESCIQSAIAKKLTHREAENRRKALQERRLSREKVINDSLNTWEKEILPNWRVVYRNPELRKLWWRGIPAKLRAPLWENVVGNELALSKGSLQLTDDVEFIFILSATPNWR
jgi:TBC1 domain family member 14